MRPVALGTMLAALLLAATAAMWLLTGGAGALAVLAGGSLPLAVSVGSLLVFLFMLRPGHIDRKGYQRFVGTNFLVKLVLMGAWLAVILLNTSLPRGPFVVSLLVNFMAWHLLEAYRYQAVALSPRGPARGGVNS